MELRRNAKRFISTLLAFVMVLTWVPGGALTVRAAEAGGEQSQTRAEQAEHPEQTEPSQAAEAGVCKYGALCDKECKDTDGDGIIDHARDCAYTLALEKELCNQECTDADGDGLTDHAQDCAFTLAKGKHTHNNSCGYKQTGETKSAAPEGETTVPEDETTAPEEETTAPEDETTAPEDETTAPEGETTAPEEETTVPKGETTAPEEETSAPEEETTAPEKTPAQQVQELIDALPEHVTEDNRDAVTEKLQVILPLYAALDEAEQEQVDITPCILLQQELDAASIPQTLADTGAFTVEGGTPGTDYTYADGVLTIKTATALTIRNTADTPTTDRIVVEKDVSADITLSGVNIDVSGTSGAAAFQIAANSTGNVAVTLEGTNTLTSGANCAGLQKNSDSYRDGIGTLTIQGTGSLNATGGSKGAGIGGGYSYSSNIVINGGDITAKGGENGAGIGGGDYGGNLTINSGTVNATGGTHGAGIGGGYGSNGTVTVSGGNVTATAGYSAAGIGGGDYGGSGTVTISGGTITATGNDFGAGIGGGYNGKGNVTITGGNVTANGSKGAGIGGDDSNSTVTINGGTVTATGTSGAGIGSAANGSGCTVTITGGNVTAASTSGAGIGDGSGGSGSSFSTGTDGHAWIAASGKTAAISNKTDSDNWSGVIFQGDEGQVYGNPTLAQDATVPTGKTLTIPAGTTLTVPENVTLNVQGTAYVQGTLNSSNDNVTGNIYQGFGAFKVEGDTSQISYADGVLTVQNGAAVEISMLEGADSPTTDRILVTGSANITLNGVSIDVSGTSDAAAFQITDNSTGNVTVTLKGSNTLTSGKNCAGLQKNGESGTLTITGEGSLTATGGDQGAGIGSGSNGGSGSNITIRGGTILASGGYYGAGIGGGYDGSGTGIVIGGTADVTATGGSNGAGIGGGRQGNGDVTIQGGTVVATGGSDGAGIGNGKEGSGGSFSTGANGSAFIDASSISDQSQKDSWSGVIIEGSVGQVYGSPTLTQNATIAGGKTVTVPAGAALTVGTGTTLTNNGTLNAAGGTVNGSVSGNPITVTVVTEDMIQVPTDLYYDGNDRTNEIKNSTKLMLNGQEITVEGWTLSVTKVDELNYTVTYINDADSTKAATKTVTLGKAQTVLTAEVTGGTAAYEYSDTITITGSVTPATNAGTVEACDENDNKISEGTVTPDADGNYTLTVPANAVTEGTHTVTVKFSGTATMAAAAQTVSVTVNKCNHAVIEGNQCRLCYQFAQASVEANGTVKCFFPDGDTPVDMTEVWAYAIAPATGTPVKILPTNRVTISAPLTLDNGKTILIDCPGNGIAGDLPGGPIIRVTDGQLTLGSTTTIANATGTGVEVSQKGTFILDGGTVRGGYGSVAVHDNGCFTMNGGELQANTTGSIALQVLGASSRVVINDGLLTGSTKGIEVGADADITITGGDFQGTYGLSTTTSLTRTRLSGGTFSSIKMTSGETVGSLLETGYAYYDTNGKVNDTDADCLNDAVSVAKDSATAVSGDLDLREQPSGTGNLDTDGYSWVDQGNGTWVLTLKDCTVTGNIILPDYVKPIIVRTEEDTYVAGDFRMEKKETGSYPTAEEYNVTFEGPAPLYVKGTLGSAGANQSKITIAPGANVTADGGVVIGASGAVDGTVTVSGTLNAVGNAGPAITAGCVVVNDGGHLNVSGTKGVSLGGKAYDIENAFQMNGGTFSGSCSDYNLFLSNSSLTEDNWKSAFSFPAGKDYIPKGFSIQYASNHDGYAVVAIAPNNTPEAALLSLTSMGGSMTLRPQSNEVGVQEVSVAGTAAERSGTSFTVILPADAKNPLTADDFQITPTDFNASASAPNSTDGGKTWTFTVTAEDEVTTRDYAIQVIRLAPVASVTVGGTTTAFGYAAESDEYKTPAEALRAAWQSAAAAGSPATLTLLSNVTLDGGSAEQDQLVVPQDGDITLKGGSYTLSGDHVSMIRVEKDGAFTLASGTVRNANAAQGGRCITAVSGSVTVSGGTVDAAHIAMSEIENGSITITGGVIHGKTCVVAAAGTVTISGGTLTGTGSNSNSEAAILVHGTSTVNITGGEITGPSGVLVSQNGTLNVSDNAKIRGESSGSGILTTTPDVKITVTGGEVIGRYGIYANGGTITVSDNGKIAGEGYGMLLLNSTVEISGGTVSGKYGVYAWTGSSVTVSGGTISSPTNSGLYVYDGSVSVTGGTVSGNNGLYFYQGSAVLSGGTFIGTTASVRSNSGNVKALLGTGCAYFTGTTIETDTEITTDDILTGNALKESDHYGTVTVSALPLTAAAQPQNQALTYGYSSAPTLTFTVTPADGNNPIIYQWYKGEEEISGANDADYTIPTGLEVGTYTYSCSAATGEYSITSQNATVTVAPKEVTVTAKDQTITYGKSITMGIDQVTITDLVSGDTLESVTLTASTENVPGGTITPSNPVIKNGDRDVTANYTFRCTNGQLTIDPKEVTADVTVEPTSFTYTGSAIVPDTVTVKDGDIIIPAGEYTVSYSGNVNAGTATVTIMDKNGGNYTVSGEAEFTITPASIRGAVVTVNGSYIYNGTAQEPETDAITVTLGGKTLTEGTDYDVTVTDNVNAGTATVTVTGMGNYTDKASTNFTIQRKPVTATVTAAEKVYNGNTNATVTATVVTGVAGETLTIDGLTGTFADADAGNGKPVTIDASGAVITGGKDTRADNYTVTFPNSVTGNILLDSMTVTATDCHETYNGDFHSITLQFPEGADVKFGPTKDSCDQDILQYSEAGTYTTWYQVTKANHETVTGFATVTIDPKEVTNPVITLSDTSYVYDGTAKKPTVTVKDGEDIIPATEYTVSYSGNVKVGTATVTITDNPNGNYTVSGSKSFTITPASIRGAVVTVDGSYTYDGTAQIPEASKITVTLNGKTLTEGTDYDVTVTDNVNAGTATVTVTGEGNYQESASGSFEIAKAKLTVTAKNQEITYGDSIVTGAEQVTAEGLVNGERLSGVTLTASTKDVPGGTITPSAAAIQNDDGEDVGGNYTITYINGDLTIHKSQPTIAFKDSCDLSKNYDGQAIPNPTADQLEITGAHYEDVVFTWSEDPVNAGTYTIIAAIPETGNTEKAEAETEVTIDPMEVTVRADSLEMVYGEKAPVLTYSVSPALVEGDTLTGITLTRNGGDGAGTYTITPAQTGSANPNYRVTFQTGKLTVLQREAKLIWSGTKLTYNGNVQAPTAAVGNLVETDICNVTVEGEMQSAGTGYQARATTLSNPNYKLPANASASFDILPKEVTVTITPGGGVYGGKITEASAVLEGTVPGDDIPKVTLTYTGTANDKTEITSETAPKLAGTYTVTASIRADNYTLSGETSARFLVERAESGLIAEPGQQPEKENWVYGDQGFQLKTSQTGDGALTYSSSDESVVTVDPDGKVTIAGAGTAEITVTTAKTANFAAGEAKISVTVEKKPITVTAADQVKTYGDPTGELTYEITEGALVEGDSLKLTLTAAGEDVGTYPITASDAEKDNPCYKITIQEGTLTIRPKDITGAKVVLGPMLLANGKAQTQQIASVTVENSQKEPLNVTYDVTGSTAVHAGGYVMTITGSGNFTGSVKQTFVIAPAAGQPVDTDGSGNVVLGNGKITVQVRQGTGAPALTLGTDKVELIEGLIQNGSLTAQELIQAAEGAELKIVLEIGNGVLEEDGSQISALAKGYTVGSLFDITLHKELPGSEDAGVHLTGSALRLTVQVPESLLNRADNVSRTFWIVRCHDGKAEFLRTKYGDGSDTLSFDTDRFSGYAIVYKDTKTSGKAQNTATWDLPRTGDSFRLDLWLGVMLISAAGAGTLAVVYRKKKK